MELQSDREKNHLELDFFHILLINTDPYFSISIHKTSTALMFQINPQISCFFSQN